MTDRDGSDDDVDPSEWLARQFGADDDTPVPPEPTVPKLTNPLADPSPWAAPPAARPPASVPPAPAPPAATPPVAPPAAPPATPPASPPPAAPPAARGGFDWGFGGGSNPVEPTEPPPAAPTEPAAPVAPVFPVAPVLPTTPIPPTEPAAPTAPPAPATPEQPPFPLTEPVQPAPVHLPGPPAQQTPAQQTPAQQTPAQQTPAQQTPAQQGWPFEAATADPAEPAPVDPAISGAPSVSTQPPAEPLPWEPAVTQAFPAPLSPAAETPTEAFVTEPFVAREAGDRAPATGIDALFGDSQFKEYEDEPVIPAIPFGANAAAAPPKAAPEKVKREPGAMPKNQKILLWVAGGVVALLVLVTLFILGTRLPDLLGAAPAVTPTPTPTPTVTAAVPAVGPIAAGTHDWNELLGGECLDPYVSPWEEEYTVVDCAAPHPAQLVARGTFPPAAPVEGAEPGDSADDPYPGTEALQVQINLLCTAPTVIDLSVAGQFSDIQFQASFAATEQQWLDGDHDYYCFVSRSSGEPLTVSIAVPQPAPAAPAA